MNIQFDALFNVEITHDYFKSGDCGVLDIEPTELCRKHLRNYGLMFRKSPKGFTVSYEYINDNQKKHPAKPMEEDVKLSFVIKSRDPFLLNYSALPLDSKADMIYLLHNLHSNKQGKDLLLSSDIGSSFLSKKDHIQLKPQFFEYSHESEHPSARVEVKDELNKQLFSEQISGVKVKKDGKTKYEYLYYVDLRKYPPGKFIMDVDGQQKLVFYSNGELAGRNIFGIIDIFQNSRVPQEYRFTDEAHDVESKTYTLKIGTRKTFWKYFVVIKYRKDISPGDIDITSSDSAIAFNKMDVKTALDGTKAVPFVSKNEIPFNEAPRKGIKLTKKKGTGANNKGFAIDNLQAPSAASIKPVAHDKVYSEMFVYI